MIWLAIFAGSIIIEMFSLTFFTLWFGFGAIVAYGLFLLGVTLWIQIAIFLVVSLVSLKFFRQYALKSYKYKTNINALIGMEAIVCGKNANGILVKVNGIEWAALYKSEKGIDLGDRVLIKGIQGVKLLIERKD
ncbi:MAG: NfeD family protein [Desulfosporosinus sp.]|nr:NfeD family protein [Desulfosporosinus sp.]